jgi:DNA polymerase III delta prime subunit|tara:strand:+ start:7884 stop:8837 length:954 start_codon:yes stop_codon:yes gene_type:complete
MTQDTLVKNYLWVEKYRPQNIDDCILPDTIKTTFIQMVESGEAQNLLLSGGAGCGKTTIAKALCNELDSDYIMINCSEDGNIDTLRTKIRSFASSISISGGKKIVILDEFDYANAQSMQPALRGFIEEFSNNCRFILTCNFKNRIIEPIHSRCTCIEFRIPNKSKPKLASAFLDRCKVVLDNEGIGYDDKVLVELILKHFPDFRRVLNELQRYSIAGTIDTGILTQIGEVCTKDLIVSMRDKNFTEVRKWVVQNLDNDTTRLFRNLYDGFYDYLKPQSIPTAILILAEYQYKDAFVADNEINTTACLVQLMMECEFK